MKKSIQVSQLLTNLSTASLSIDAALSNAAKSAERVEWFQSEISENRLTDFLVTIEQAIDSLPEGTLEVATIHPVTGVKSTKKVNRRDIAKAAFKTAFGHAVKGHKTLSGKVLSFKLSVPLPIDKAAPKSLEDKLATLFKDSIDSAGLKVIIETANIEIKRHASEVVELAANHAAMELKATIAADVAAMMQRGKTIDQAQALAAALNDLTLDELRIAIG
jgi:hypothetical protein